MISQKRIKVNGEIVNKADIKVDVNTVNIEIDRNILNIKEFIYLMLNKPKGYVSATEDKKDKTVLELVPKQLYRNTLFPAGRLDKDTTGLMIITNDGKLAHNILAPKKHVKKVYDVMIDIDVTDEMVNGFKEGIKLNDGICKTSQMTITGKNTALVTLTEGRYHQIKRMFGCFGATVIMLHRLSMGNLNLPDNLKEGECRELTEDELLKLQEKNK